MVPVSLVFQNAQLWDTGTGEKGGISMWYIVNIIFPVILDAYGIDVKLEPLCLQRNGSNACAGIKYGQTVEFNVTFSFDECNENTPEALTLPIVVTGTSYHGYHGYGIEK